MAYQIRFENKPDATGPARQIVVTDTLDPNLDLDTFQLSEITFANQAITVPPGLDHYEMTVPIAANGTNIPVDVQTALDRGTRQLTLTLRAIDPSTGWIPEDPTVGLLYPDDATGRGQGSISYSAAPLAGVPSATAINNRASIVFDYNDPIATPLAHNTLDAGPPTSHVLPLPTTQTGGTFTVQWAGQDEAGGSGIASYDVYVSVDGGPYILLIGDTTDTSTTVVGQPGHTYAFYSVATDNVGHVEPMPSPPQSTTLTGSAPTSSVGHLPTFTPTTNFAVSWSGTPGTGASNIASYDIFVSIDDGSFTPFVTGTTQTSANFTGTFGHSYGFISVATDNLGNRQVGPVSAQAITRLVAPPTSSVSPLPAVTPTPSFTVNWSGTPGAGAASIASYDVYVSTDGGAFTRFVVGSTQTAATFTGAFGHTYSFYSIATDDVGNVEAAPSVPDATTTVPSANRPPVLDDIADQSVNEGDGLQFTASATDPDAGDVLTFSLDPGAPAGARIDPATGAFTWTPPNGPATVSITVRVSDNGTPNLSDTRTFTVSVRNVPPRVTAPVGGTIIQGSSFTAAGFFADPGADTWTATVNYGDGTGDQPLALNADKTFTLSHSYAAAGTFTVTTTVTDKDGGRGSGTTVVTVQPPLAIVSITVNDGSAQRSNIEQLSIRFNEDADLQRLIDDGTIGSAVQLFGVGQVVISSSRFRYDASTFTLVIDLTTDGFGGSQATLLADGRYELRLNAGLISAKGLTTNHLVDDDGTDDGVRRNSFHRLRGDFNGDAQVDLADRDLFYAHYGSRKGQAAYDYAFDLDGDGVIGLADYMLWTKLLGRTV
jgi:hypothetical protein